jgi:hypothetical protein
MAWRGAALQVASPIRGKQAAPEDRPAVSVSVSAYRFSKSPDALGLKNVLDHSREPPVNHLQSCQPTKRLPSIALGVHRIFDVFRTFPVFPCATSSVSPAWRGEPRLVAFEPLPVSGYTEPLPRGFLLGDTGQ